jgi:exopolysaccharide biosynthesis polyprenyl glycosylphosphotransferase
LDLEGYEAVAEQLLNQLVDAGLTVHVTLPQFSQSIRNKQIHSVGNVTMVTSSMNLVPQWKLAVKRIIDIVGALVGLLFTGIACIIFAPIIKHQSPGPLFFAQERVGRNGRTFKIYKFRTMYPDAEERKKELMAQNKMQGLMFKMDNDPRIFPIGHFLRKASIDELPQFLNVLKGDMSLVGTRPPTMDEYKQYDMHHLKRLAAKPGLTGMWQASGRSDITDFEEVVRLDAYYIENWKLSLDFKLILKTIRVVFSAKGAE